MLSILRRAPARELTEFEAARAAWNAAAGRMHELRAEIEARTLALRLTAPGMESTGEVPAHLQARAEPHLRRARVRRPALIDEIAGFEEQVVQATAEHEAERVAWQRAQRHETDAIAQSLQPRQRDAARRIAAALEALSEAVADEAGLHNELREHAPLSESAYLPDLHRELIDACLSRHGSSAWQWARRVRGLGILES